jgi:hypothetical protein
MATAGSNMENVRVIGFSAVVALVEAVVLPLLQDTAPARRASRSIKIRKIAGVKTLKLLVTFIVSSLIFNFGCYFS